jgi:phosphoribosylpyrophosphate synthetase
VLRFSEGALFPRVLENVRGRRVYLVQSTVFPANDHVMELLFWVDAFKRASAMSVTVVMPYFSYAKGDKKDEPRVSIRAWVCADAIEAAGADRVVTAAVTHGVFAEGSMRRLDACPIRRLIVTDTVETQPTALSGKVRVVSVAPLFAEAIRRIHHRERISGLFQD